MLRFLSCWLVPAALLTCTAAAASEVPPRSGKADPLDARVAIPPLVHRSAFADYRAHAEAAAIDWRQANDTVTRIGGWRAYAREAREPSPAPAADTKAKP